MDWFNFLIFAIIPVFTVAAVFCWRRKLLWTAPLISTALTFLAYAVAFDLIIEKPLSIFRGLINRETLGFLFIGLSMHFGITVILTLITVCVAHILKREK